MRFHTALLIFGIFALVGCDRTPDPICQELDATIDGSIKKIALSLVDGDISDKGAIQQAARYIAANNYFQVIRISIDLQSQHKCPIRKSVINPMMYRTEALACIEATLKYEGDEISKRHGRDGAQDTTPKYSRDEMSKLCDSKNWKGTALWQ